MISTGNSIFQLIIVLACFVVVLLLAYFTTKWLATYQKGRSFNKNLKIIETIKLTSDKYVQIVACGKDKFLIIGLGKTEVTLLGELTKEELIDFDSIMADLENSNNVTTGFNQIIDKVKSNKK